MANNHKAIKPIETSYKGYRFRSRLEARWAVFFDACGVKWEYEPEGFSNDGVYYLPDFLLHGVKGRGGQWGGELYIEVKGDSESGHLNPDDLRKVDAVGKHYDWADSTPGSEEAFTKINPQFCDKCPSHEKCRPYCLFRKQNTTDPFVGRWYELVYSFNYSYSKYSFHDLWDSHRIRLHPSGKEPDISLKGPDITLTRIPDSLVVLPMSLNGNHLEIPLRARSRRCVCDKYLAAENNAGWRGIPLLVVDNIFGCLSCSDLQSHFCRWGCGYDDSDFYVFTWIDEDRFPICMGLNEHGDFQIDTCEDSGVLDDDATLWALNKAKQARFEHGETKIPISWKEHLQAYWDRRAKESRELSSSNAILDDVKKE